MHNTKKAGYTFIDLYSKMIDKEGKLDSRYAVDDGLHLNDNGYRRWVELLKEAKHL